MKRPKVPQRVQTEVLITYRRRCAFCFGLDNDVAEKLGQIAHIDRDRNNNSIENLAFLCNDHHSRYDTAPSQAKGYTAGELKEYQATLHVYLQALARGAIQKTDGRRPTRTSTEPRHGISLELYDRRVPTYRTVIHFVREVVKDLRPTLQLILQFTADTDEALFLFDNDLVLYLNDLVRRALRLHTISLMRERIATDEVEATNFRNFVTEETELAVWFSEQGGEIKTRFEPFLKLA